MPREIERKFLVKNNDWKGGVSRSFKIMQGYLLNTPEKVVRVRVSDNGSYITIKSGDSMLSRDEYEYNIPYEDALELFALCDSVMIKTRHVHLYGGNTWEIDVFTGINQGLVVAEIELDSEDQEFDRPSWLDKEVTDDPRYANNNLITSKAPCS
jgi:adenylate cyclase